MDVLANSLRHCSTLEELQLNNISPDGDRAKRLSFYIWPLGNLHTLGIAKNGITHYDDVSAHLRHCTRLQRLDLQGNRIDKRSVNAIFRSLKSCCKNFKRLDITDYWFINDGNMPF